MELIIKSANLRSTKKLLALKEICEMKIKCFLPERMNYAEGVVNAPELADIPECEILSQLKSENLTYVRRRKDPSSTYTSTADSYQATDTRPTFDIPLENTYVNHVSA